MPELLQYLEANWWVATVALIVLIGITRWIFAATRKTTITREDAHDDAAEQGAKRNQALIDAEPASQTPLAMAAVPDDEATSELAPKPQPQTAPEIAPSPVPAQAAATDTPAGDIGELKGVGAKLVTMLGDLGVTSIAQMAVWDEAEIDRIDTQLGRFQGRIRRDNWVLQAQLLQSGDIAAYEEKFGKR